LKTASIILIER